MVQINFALKTVTVKIVYYGPGMSGKTTNLEVVHQRAPDSNRGDLTSIATDGDRTLFFDFMPLDLGTVAGMRTQFQIYTVPGQVYYNSTRKLVLQGVDGVIFIADSSASMLEENLESLRNLEENLEEYGKSLDTVPHVIQYNKRDLPDAMSVEELEAALNRCGAPSFEGIASSGQGVFPTLKALAANVLDSIHSQQDGSAAGAPAAAASPAAPAPGVNAGTGFYPLASVPTAPAAPASTGASNPGLSATPPVGAGSTGFYQAQSSAAPASPANQELPAAFPQAGPAGPASPPPVQHAPPVPQAPPVAPIAPIAPVMQTPAQPAPPTPVAPPAPQAPMAMPAPPPMPPAATPAPLAMSPPAPAPMPTGQVPQPGQFEQPAGMDMSQTQVHAPPVQQQQPVAQPDLRMVQNPMGQPVAGVPGAVLPSMAAPAAPGPGAMMQPPAQAPMGGTAPAPFPAQGAPVPGAPSRLKPRSTALPTPRNPGRSRSGARTAIFIALALAAGVVLGSLVISIL